MSLFDYLSESQNEIVSQFLEPVAAPFREINDTISGATTDMTDSIITAFGITPDSSDSSSIDKKKKLKKAGMELGKQALIKLFTGS